MSAFNFAKYQPNKRLFTVLMVLLTLPMISQATQNTHLRGQRYCEIIFAKTLSTYAVYNTWGLNDCPEKVWRNITTAEVKKETNTSLVHLNGPRYWVFDGFQHSSLINPAIRTIAGLKVREAGVLHLSPLDLLKSGTYYQERKVARNTTWIYQLNKPVYELIDPKGQVFIMQSYSTQKYPQTQKSLALLGTTLKLPAGWQFKTGKLKKAETLEAIQHQAIVVQDNALNTYQLATHDFLSK